MRELLNVVSDFGLDLMNWLQVIENGTDKVDVYLSLV